MYVSELSYQVHIFDMVFAWCHALTMAFKQGNCLTSRFAQMRTTIPERAKGGGRGRDDALIGVTVKICQGGYKGCWGRVKGVKGSRVRIELESQANCVEGKFSPLRQYDLVFL